MIVDKFDIINKTITKGSIKERNAKLEYFIKQSDSLNKFGMDIFQMEEYFDEIINNIDTEPYNEIDQKTLEASQFLKSVNKKIQMRKKKCLNKKKKKKEKNMKKN